MSKMKVSELAAEVNLKSKEIVDFLHENGYENVKNMNNICFYSATPYFDI